MATAIDNMYYNEWLTENSFCTETHFAIFIVFCANKVGSSSTGISHQLKIQESISIGIMFALCSRHFFSNTKILGKTHEH
jgi:hypothetical protein